MRASGVFNYYLGSMWLSKQFGSLYRGEVTKKGLRVTYDGVRVIVIQRRVALAATYCI